MRTGLRTTARRLRDAKRRKERSLHPQLLRLLVPELRDAVAGNRRGAARTLLDEAISTTDASGADLDVLIDAAFLVNVADLVRQLAAFIDEHGGEAPHASSSRFPRLRSLVDILDGPQDGLDGRLDAWATSRADRVFAFEVALALKLPHALTSLASDVEPDDLTVAQRSRAALALWRVGDNDQGLALARAVPAGDNAAARRARMVTGEHESFALLDSGW
ncbi:MAG: hypothetical protein ABIN55_08845, partial [Aeromicrobium sp.]